MEGHHIVVVDGAEATGNQGKRFQRRGLQLLKNGRYIVGFAKRVAADGQNKGIQGRISEELVGIHRPENLTFVMHGVME
jgi:hypothetical protein